MCSTDLIRRLTVEELEEIAAQLNKDIEFGEQAFRLRVLLLHKFHIAFLMEASDVQGYSRIMGALGLFIKRTQSENTNLCGLAKRVQSKILETVKERASDKTRQTRWEHELATHRYSRAFSRLRAANWAPREKGEIRRLSGPASNYGDELLRKPLRAEEIKTLSDLRRLIRFAANTQYELEKRTAALTELLYFCQSHPTVFVSEMRAETYDELLRKLIPILKQENQAMNKLIYQVVVAFREKRTSKSELRQQRLFSLEDRLLLRSKK